MSCFFSVIVPVYNTEKYLHECVDSILSQTFTDFEVILVNDGSVDNSGKICDEYAEKDKRIKVIHKENGGASTARNKGLTVAVGDYILFADSDDFYIESNSFKKIYETAITTKVDIVLFKALKYFFKKKAFVDHYGDYSKKNLSSDDSNVIFDGMVRDGKQFAAPWNKAVKRQLLVEHGIFFKEGVIAEDVLWSVEIFEKAKKARLINENVYAYRQNVDNSVTATFTEKKFFDLYSIIEELVDKYSPLNTEFSKTVMSFIAFEYAILLFNISSFDNYKEYSFVRKNDFVLKYSLDKKTKLIKHMYKILGFNMLMKVFRFKRGFKS